ncbi:MAG: hypothetical protein AB8C95_03030 [Phycisphaeraceae bacterium]
MKTFSRILTLMLMVSALTCWAQPAAAARLANVSGETGDNEQREDAEFKLSDHSQVEVLFKINKLEDACNVMVRIHRKQENGKWLVINTTLRTSKSTNGSRKVTLPAGEYKIEVISKQAKYDVSVDN